MLYDKCPECGHEGVADTLEDEGVLYQCQSCDWMTVATSPFCPGAWDVQIRRALALIDILQSMLDNKDAVSFLKLRLEGVSHLTNYQAWSLSDSANDEYLRGEMDIARDVYLRQMIVLAATYVELILTDFLRCVYLTEPQRMNQVLPPHGKSHASVALTEIIQSDCKEELLANLADRAARHKGDGEPDKIVRQLVKDCHLKLHLPLVDDLKNLKELRNRIVHDDTEETVTFQEVHSTYGMIVYLLYILAQATAWSGMLGQHWIRI
jgi:hypothetical protein